MNKSAFTLSEMIIVLALVSFIAVVVIITLFHDESRKEKINKTTSITLYSNFEKIYEDILTNGCTKIYDLSTLKDADSSGEVNSADISYHIRSSYIGEVASCQSDKLVLPAGFNLNQNAACVDMAPNAFAAVYYDRACTTAVTANEYIGKQTQTYNNTCGYIVYSLKDSKGEFGIDTFVYPLLKGTKITAKRKIRTAHQ